MHFICSATVLVQDTDTMLCKHCFDLFPRSGFYHDGFKGIMYGITQSVVSFQRLPVHLCLALAEMVAVTLGHLPAYLSAPVPMVEIPYRLAVIVHSIIDDMQVRMFLVRMQYGHILGVLDPHLFHVLPCVL